MKAIVAGSFDPITDGHVWVIAEAQKIFHQVFVVIAENPSKTYSFSTADRADMIKMSMRSVDASDILVLNTREPLVKFARRHGVDHVVRGIRDIHDFTYETQLANINRAIEPTVETIYVIPPKALTEVSSSMIRGLVGLEGWEDIVAKYVPPVVVEALKRRYDA